MRDAQAEERETTRTTAAAIVESVRDGAGPALPFDWPTKVPLDCPDCPVTAAEDLIVQLAREVVALVEERGLERPTPEPERSSRWQDHVAAYPREEFLAAFREAHATLHRLWTEAVGKEGYDKASWRSLDNALSRFARDAAEKIGIGRSEPLL